MTLAQFQECDKINNSLFDDVDKMALIICCLWNKTPEQVDSFTSKKFLKRVSKIEKIFAKGFAKPFYVQSRFETDAEKITFGQFIECQEWLKQDPTHALHLVAASIYKGDRSNHKLLADKMLNTKANYLLNDCLTFINSLAKLVESYKNLFASDEVQDEDLDELKKKQKLQKHPFIEYYGWEFSATQVAEHNRFNDLNKAYELNVIEALNNLAYLKTKQSYEQQQSK